MYNISKKIGRGPCRKKKGGKRGAKKRGPKISLQKTEWVPGHVDKGKMNGGESHRRSDAFLKKKGKPEF